MRAGSWCRVPTSRRRDPCACLLPQQAVLYRLYRFRYAIPSRSRLVTVFEGGSVIVLAVRSVVRCSLGPFSPPLYSALLGGWCSIRRNVQFTYEYLIWAISFNNILDVTPARVPFNNILDAQAEKWDRA